MIVSGQSSQVKEDTMSEYQTRPQQPEHINAPNHRGLANHRLLGNKEQIGSPPEEKTPSLSKLLQTQKSMALLTDHKSMAYCLAFGYSQHVKVSAHKGKSARVTGVVRCNNSNCIVCSKIKAKEQSKDIELVLKYHGERNSNIAFLTLTKSKTLSIEKSYKQTRMGVNAIRKHLNNLSMRKSYKIPMYGVIEDTFSKEPVQCGKIMLTTTHNHLHLLLIFPNDISKLQREEVIKSVSEVWRATIKKTGGYVSGDHAIDIKWLDNNSTTIENLAGYMSKLISASTRDQSKGKIEYELTHSHRKSGKGRSMYQLLIDIATYGEAHDIRAWKSTINAYYRKSKKFTNKLWKEVLKPAKEALKEQKKQYAEKYCEALVNNDTVFMDKYIKEWVEEGFGGMSFQDYKQQQEETVEVSIPKDMYDYISISGANPHLLELVRLASIDPELSLFRRFKAFCEANPHYTNPLRKKTPKLSTLDCLIMQMKEEISL